MLLTYLGLLLIIIIVWKLTKKTKEGFGSYYDYTRAYPSDFAFRPGYNYYYPYLDHGRNIRYNAGYRDYWYIPAHAYMDNWMNGVAPESQCIAPPVSSESCLFDMMQQTGNLDLSMARCTYPGPISESCNGI